MPLAAFSMDPVTAAHLAAIGLPYGPNTNPGLGNPASGPGGPSASYNALNTSTQLGASPALNGATQSGQAGPQAAAQQENQQASQQDTQAIFSGSQPPPTSQASRLAQAQAATQPSPPIQQDPLSGSYLNGQEPPVDLTPYRKALSGAGDWLSGQMAQVKAAGTPQSAQVASDSAASGPSPQVPPAAAPGGPSGAPQAPQATTLAVNSQTAPVTPPGSAGAPVGPGATPVAASAALPGSPKGPIGPADIANAIYGQESSYGQNTKTSSTGARGGMQIEPKTWAQYAQPGEDINNPTDNRNVGNRIVQDPYQKAGGDPARVAVGYFSGPDNIAPPGSPTPWLTDKNDGHTSVSQYVAGVLGKLGQPVPAGQGGWASAGGGMGPNSPPGAYSAIDAIHQGSAIGLDPQDMMKLATSLGYKPVDTQAFNNRNLIAMGMAMMGGRTFADSMKNGAGVMNDSNNAMLGVQEKQNANALQMAQVGINAKRADVQMSLEQQRLAAMDRPRAVGAPTQDANGNWQQMFLDPRTSSTFAQPTGTPAGYASSDPTRKGLAASATEGAKEASKNFEEIQDNGNAATQKLQLINSVQKQLDSGKVTPGPAAAAQLKTTIANWLGVPFDGADPNANQALVQAISAARGNGVMGKNMRTQREFDTVMQGALNYNGQNPAVLQQTLNAMRNVELAKQQMQQRINADPNAANIRRDPIAMANFQQKFFTDWSNQQDKQGGINNPQPGTVIHYDATGKPITQ